MTRALAFGTVGLVAGFSGVAMIAHIVTGGPLLLIEAVAIAILLTVLLVVRRRTPPHVRAEIFKVARAGIVAGAIATLAYDIARTGLSIADPSPYNPFEAIRRFGYGILPAQTDPGIALGVGYVIHLVNGSSFGVIYAMFARRHLASFRTALLSGMGWGLVLEFVQSILYPGWLGITTVLGEFLVISGAGHLVYGATLGLGLRRLLGADTKGE